MMLRRFAVPMLAAVAVLTVAERADAQLGGGPCTVAAVATSCATPITLGLSVTVPVFAKLKVSDEEPTLTAPDFAAADSAEIEDGLEVEDLDVALAAVAANVAWTL